MMIFPILKLLIKNKTILFTLNKINWEKEEIWLKIINILIKQLFMEQENLIKFKMNGKLDSVFRVNLPIKT